MDIEDIMLNTFVGSVILAGIWAAVFAVLLIARASMLSAEGLPVHDPATWVYVASTIVTCLVASYLIGKGLD